MPAAPAYGVYISPKPVISHERGKDGDVLRTSERRV
jgi:hypothetical protein